MKQPKKNFTDKQTSAMNLSITACPVHCGSSESGYHLPSSPLSVFFPCDLDDLGKYLAFTGDIRYYATSKASVNIGISPADKYFK